MSALSYLLKRNLINRIKDMKNHPGQIVLTIIFIAIIVINFIVPSNAKLPEEYADIGLLNAIIFALYLLIFVPSILTGFSSGATFFTMADLNMVFLSPIPTRKVLIYGLIKQAGTSLWIGFFLLFQYYNINNAFGVEFFPFLGIIFGYCLLFFTAQLTSMAIYSFTANNDNLKIKLKYALYVCLCIIAIFVAKDALFSDDKINAITKGANQTWTFFIPIIGWIKAFAVGLVLQNYSYILLGLLVTVVYILIVVYVIGKVNTDFYEDVLQATEVAYSAITAKKEGKINDVPKNVKVGKTGVGGGLGANAFFSKHLLEDRRCGIMFFDRSSVIFMLATIGFSFLMREEGVIPAFIFAVYMQIFAVATGRWVKELLLPYVYLIPESSFKKLICICKETILKNIIDAVIVMTAIGLIVNLPIPAIIAMIFARISIGLLIISTNLLVERLFGKVTSKGLILVFYFLTIIILLLPGFIIGLIITSTVAEPMKDITMFISLFAVNVPLAALLTFLCKDILNYAEINNR